MSWVQAVKEYSKVKGSFSIPKKDTPEYDEVKKIQEKMKAGTWGEVPKKEEVKPAVDSSVKVERKKKSDRTSEPVTVVTGNKKDVVEPAEAIKRGRPKKGDVKVSEALETSNKHNITKPVTTFEGAESTRSKRAKDKEPTVVPTVEKVEKPKVIRNTRRAVLPSMSIKQEKVIMDFS